MSSIAISGDTSGAVTIAAPAIAGTNTMTLVAGTGTLAPKVLSTAVTATSGTSIDFTNIPSWVTRITVMYNGISTSGTSSVAVQLGSSSGIESSGYNGYTYRGGGGLAYSAAFTTDAGNDTAAQARYGSVVITNLSGNTWTETHLIGIPALVGVVYGAGAKTLSATLDRVRITTLGGSDTFDAGTINILYE